MKLTFAPKHELQIDDARILFRNFQGRGDRYNKEGDRNFAILIPDDEIAQALLNDINEYGASWNVKIKPPREEGDTPFMYLPVKVKFNSMGPKVYLESIGKRVMLDENTIGEIDDLDIAHVNLDIRPYDSTINGKPFRAAYLNHMHIVQNVDRFAAQFAEDEYPED